jgi:hypothetical protein
MIIIKIQGGLGNQLLQYSIGRVIARQYDKEVAYDLSFYEGDTKYTERPYLLDLMHTTVRKATSEEILEVRYPYGIFSKVFEKIYRGFNKYIQKKYYVGYVKTFLPSVQKKDTAYFEGFWQSYRYYEESLPLLSKEISLKDSGKLVAYIESSGFKSQTSVSVHIRRGDLLNSGSGIQVLPKEYYIQAVAHVESKVSNPAYYIFSDDIAWVKEEMGDLFKNAVYPSLARLTDVEEFMLMKACNHAIIANSTFSWFSALLTNDPQKHIVYSKDWKNPFLNGNTEICPPTWVGL